MFILKYTAKFQPSKPLLNLNPTHHKWAYPSFSTFHLKSTAKLPNQNEENERLLSHGEWCRVLPLRVCTGPCPAPNVSVQRPCCGALQCPAPPGGSLEWLSLRFLRSQHWQDVSQSHSTHHSGSLAEATGSEDLCSGGTPGPRLQISLWEEAVFAAQAQPWCEFQLNYILFSGCFCCYICMACFLNVHFFIFWIRMISRDNLHGPSVTEFGKCWLYILEISFLSTTEQDRQS